MSAMPKLFKFDPELSHLLEVTVAEGPEVKVPGTDILVWSDWTASKGLRVSFDLSTNRDYSLQDVITIRDGLTDLINKLEGK